MANLEPRRDALPVLGREIVEAEQGVRYEQAVLDGMRRARSDLYEQVKVLRRIVEKAVEIPGLVDAMREAGELVPEEGRPGKGVRSSDGYALQDLGLSRRRVSEWRSLAEHDALAYLDALIAAGREREFEKASVNWLRQRVERIAREGEPPDVDAEYIHGDVTIRHGDLRSALADLVGRVDAIVTDPPYPQQYFDEWDALGRVAADILTPTGVLVAMSGQAWLPQYLRLLGPHLDYRWSGAYLTDGPATRVHSRNVGTKWKPILIFGGEAFITQDVYTSERDGKRRAGWTNAPAGPSDSDWGQSEPGIAELVERFTSPGQLVVDPFLGGGTTAVVCRELGRRFIGCDRDPAAIAATQERLA